MGSKNPGGKRPDWPRQVHLVQPLPQMPELAAIHAVGGGFHPSHQFCRWNASQGAHQQAQANTLVLEGKQRMLQQRCVGCQFVWYQQATIFQTFDAADRSQAGPLCTQEVWGAYGLRNPGVADIVHVRKQVVERKTLTGQELSSEVTAL